MKKITRILRRIAVFFGLVILGINLLFAAGKLVYRIPIEGVIDLGLSPYIERVVSQAEEDDADLIVFEVNTFGGRVDAATEIRDAILNSSVPTLAFINKRAISAGALISLACKEIYMTSGATIGAATVVDMQGEKAGEKQISYWRSEMRATAERNNRPPEIAEAMVDETIEIPGLSEKGKLVTLTTGDAIEWKMADGEVEDFQSLLALEDLSDARVITPELNWAEYVVRFLTHPIVSSFLLSIGFLGLLFEIQSPGWGVAGIVGLTSLALFFGSHLILGLAGWEELLLFGTGIILLILEAFVIPGFGVAGVLGIVLVAAGIFLSLVGSVPTTEDFIRAAGTFVSSFIITVIGAIAIAKFVPRTRSWKFLYLSSKTDKEEGYSSSEIRKDLIGKIGIALTDLHPSGTVLIGEERLDVVSEGEYIPANTKVKVLRSEGYRLVVRLPEEGK